MFRKAYTYGPLSSTIAGIILAILIVVLAQKQSAYQNGVAAARGTEGEFRDERFFDRG